MKLIRYQSPGLDMWPSVDRWINLRDEINDLFEVPSSPRFGQQSQLFSGWTPAMDLYQNNDNIVAMVELPGMCKEDIEISLNDGVLSVSGERVSEQNNGDNAERTERFAGKFRRSISLPARVDANKVSATYKDGILTITLPKAEEAKPKQIKVSAS